jgi:hypothetical protein
MAPDGFAYLLDDDHPGTSYVVDSSLFVSALPKRLEELEGRAVTFTLRESQPVLLVLVEPESLPKKRAVGVGERP